MAVRTIKQHIAAKNRPDTLADIAARIKRNAACQQAHTETIAKFGQITAENIDAALAYQEQRIAELEQE